MHMYFSALIKDAQIAKKCDSKSIELLPLDCRPTINTLVMFVEF